MNNEKITNIMLTDNNGNYYGRYVIKGNFTEDYLCSKIKEIVCKEFQNYETFLEDFSWNILKVADFLNEELKRNNKLANCDFEFNDERTLNVDNIFNERGVFIDVE